MAKAKARKSPKTPKKKTTSRARTTPAKRARAKAPAAKSKSTGFSSAAIGLTVNDLAASLSWYCNVLGFAIKEKWEQNGVLLGAAVSSGGSTINIGQDDWQKGRDRQKGEGVRLYLTLKSRKDIDRYAAAIQSRGGALASEPQDVWGVRAFSLVDPSGFKLTVTSED